MTWPVALIVCAALADIGGLMAIYLYLFFAGALEKREARIKSIESSLDNLKVVVATNATALKRVQDRETGNALKGLKV